MALFLMKISISVPLPIKPTMKIIVKTGGAKYVSSLFPSGTKFASSEMKRVSYFSASTTID